MATHGGASRTTRKRGEPGGTTEHGGEAVGRARREVLVCYKGTKRVKGSLRVCDVGVKGYTHRHLSTPPI
jgi:hypothetical protein